jgi:hypothetical protein
MADENQGALDWLAKLAQQGGTDQLTPDQLLGTRSELNDYYESLKGKPKEPGYEGEAGAQFPRPNASFDARQKLSPLAQQLADVDFQREGAVRQQREHGETTAAWQKANRAMQWAPLAQAAADLPKTLTLGYGPSFQGHFGLPPAEQMSQAHSQAVFSAVAERIKERHPELSDDQIQQQAQQATSEGATVRGGALGWAQERLAPGALPLLAMGPAFTAAGGLARAGLSAVGVGEAAEATTLLGKIGLAAAQGATTGAIYGAARAREGQELEEAGSLYGQVVSRAKTALTGAAAFGAGETLSSAVLALPLAGTSGALTKAFGASEAAATLAGFLQKKAASTANMAGMAAAQDPAAALKHPLTTIAEAATAAMLPERFTTPGIGAAERALAWGAERVGVPESIRAIIPGVRAELEARDTLRAAQAGAALVENAYSEATDDIIAHLNGLTYLPSHLKDAILDAHRRNREADQLVSQGMEARAQKMPGSAEEERAGAEFNFGIGEASLPGIERNLRNAELESLRAQIRRSAPLQTIVSQMAAYDGASPEMPTDVQGVQALRMEAARRMNDVAALAAGSTTQKETAFWTSQQRQLDGIVNALDAQIRGFQTNPGSAHVDESLTHRALRQKDPGAKEVAQQEVAAAIADNTEAAPKPPPGPPAQPVREPGELWTPDALDVLNDKLTDFFRTSALLSATQGDTPSPNRVRAESALNLLKADIDRMLVPREGGTLEQLIGTTKADSPDWWKNPALSKISPWLGWMTPEGTLSHVAGEATKPIVSDPDALAAILTDGVAKDVESKVRAAATQRTRGAPDLADRVADRAFDVLAQSTQAYVRANPGKARDAEWVKAGQDFATKRAIDEARSLSKRIASYYGARDAAKKFVVSTDDVLQDARRQVDEAATKPADQTDPLGDVNTVLKIAKAKGSPLENMDDATVTMAANVFLHELGEARRKAQGGAAQARANDRPGRTPYELAHEVYVAQHGEESWQNDLTPAERTKAGRAMRKELAPTIDALHEYLKQVNELNATTKAEGGETPEFNSETGSFDPVALAKLPFRITERLGSLLWKNVKNLYDDEGYDYYRFTKENWAARPPASAHGVLSWVSHQLGAGERELNTSGLGRLLEIEVKGRAEKGRLVRDRMGRGTSYGKDAAAQTLDQRQEVGRYIDGYRSLNDGKEVDKPTADRMFADRIKSFPPEIQETMKRAAAQSRPLADWLRSYAEEHSGRKIGYTSSYLPHAEAEETLKIANATDFGARFQNAWKTISDGFSRDLSDEQAMKASGTPFNSSILSRTKNGVAYDLDYYRSLMRYGSWIMDWAWKMEAHNYWKDQRLGRYETMNVDPESRPGDLLSRFVTASDNKDAIKIGGSYWKLAEKPGDNDKSFELRNIGRPGESMLLRAEKGAEGWKFWRQMTTQGPAGPHGEPQRVVTSERPVFPQIRQGGLEQLSSVDKNGNVVAKTNEAVLKQGEERLAALIGPRSYTRFDRAVNGVMTWAARSIFLGNHVAAARALTEGTAFAMMHFGPKLYGDSIRFMMSKEGREALHDMGSDAPNLRATETLAPDSSFAKTAAAKIGSGMQIGDFMLIQADQFLKSQALAAGLLRARRLYRKFGIPESEMADLARDYAPEDIPEVWARREAYVQASHTGALRAAATAPLINQTPYGRLITQFKRPALLVSAATIGAVKQGMRTGNFTPMLRFAAIAGLFAWMDDAFQTNFGELLGPRVKDVGEEQTGAGLSHVLPALDDEDSKWSILGNARIPMPNPLGEGPVASAVGDFGRLAGAWLRGDDNELARQFWESKNLTERAADQWVPGYKVGRKLAAAIDPTLPGTRLQPSGDPERPWKTVNEKGRVISLTNQEMLWKQFLLGSLGNRETSETLHAMDRARLEDDIEAADKRNMREDWFNATQEARQTGSAAAMQRADELRAKFRFTHSDYQHEVDMRSLPNWARFAGKTEEQKARAIFDVASHRDEIGATAEQLRLAIEKNLHHPSRLSPDAVRKLASLQRELWPQGR